jgi:hypothetical protein
MKRVLENLPKASKVSSSVEADKFLLKDFLSFSLKLIKYLNPFLNNKKQCVV